MFRPLFAMDRLLAVQRLDLAPFLQSLDRTTSVCFACLAKTADLFRPTKFEKTVKNSQEIDMKIQLTRDENYISSMLAYLFSTDATFATHFICIAMYLSFSMYFLSTSFHVYLFNFEIP